MYNGSIEAAVFNVIATENMFGDIISDRKHPAMERVKDAFS
jgi:Isocitrate/isopropylmalate dehydrogenase